MTVRFDSYASLFRVSESIERYYSDKISMHGATPMGVDWSCAATQELRFTKLLKICDFSTAFSLNDFGCGYGALLAYLAKHYPDKRINYLGIDLSAEMIRNAKRLWRNKACVEFLLTNHNTRIADYSIASGVFNVKLDHPIELWERYIASLLLQIHATSRRGFAVNFVAPKLQALASASGLYRTPPEPWILHCEREFSSNVQLIGGYGLHEFTLLVRTPAGQRQ